MDQTRLSRELIATAARACRFAGLAGLGYRAGVPRRRRGPGGMVCLLAVAVASLAAVGVPGVWQSAALASSRSGLNWTQQTPATSPPARAGGSMAYDAATRTVVLFGGGARAPFADSWTWDGYTC